MISVILVAPTLQNMCGKRGADLFMDSLHNIDSLFSTEPWYIDVLEPQIGMHAIPNPLHHAITLVVQ